MKLAGYLNFLRGCGLAAMLLASLLFQAPAASVAASPSTHFVTVKKINGRWWLINLRGHRFISCGVDAVNPIGKISQQLGSSRKQRAWAAAHFSAWGFNTLGAWSNAAFAAAAPGGKAMYQTPILNLGAEYVAKVQRGKQAWLAGIFPDVFDSEFKQLAYKTAVKLTNEFKSDPHVIGYFSDNELHWGPDWRGNTELLMAFLHEPSAAPGHSRAVEFLEQRYPQVSTFNRIWHEHQTCLCHLLGESNIPTPYKRGPIYSRNAGREAALNKVNPGRARFFADCDAFAAIVAHRYFRICRDAIMRAAPNHLYLGCRFAYYPGRGIVAAAAEYADVISLNCYDRTPAAVLARYKKFNKPLMITEFAFRARDSGLPNTKGAGILFDTQSQRAAATAEYIKTALGCGQVVGYHWFEYADEPRAGRFDGENSNYGLVRRNAHVYRRLTRALSAVNHHSITLHEQSR